MKCLRTLSVFTMTFSIAWSMALDSTSPRYLEDSTLPRSISIVIDKSQLNYNHNTSHILDLNSSLDIKNSQNNLSSTTINPKETYKESSNSDLNESLLLYKTTHLTDNNKYNESSDIVQNSENYQSRKLKTHSSKFKETALFHNFKTNTIKTVKRNSTRHKTSAKYKLNKKNENVTVITHNKKEPHSKKPVKMKATTSKPIKQMKLSTFAPITIILTKPTTTKPSANTPKYYKQKTSKRPTLKPKLTTIKPNKKAKPTIKNITTKLSENSSNTANLKQNWYEEGVPYPNPMPEISSNSPPFSISDAGSQILSSTIENSFVENIIPSNVPIGAINPEISTNSPSEVLQGVPSILPLAANDDSESISVPAADSNSENANPLSNAISTFNLDLLPSSSLNRDAIGGGNGCPTVHISSSVLSPSARQECSDLSLVLNTHYHQNQNGQNGRLPQISTYDADGADGVPVEAAAEDVIPEDAAVADPVLADDVANAGAVGPADDLANSGAVGDPGNAGGVPAGSSGGSSGGSGGSGGSGSNGSNGGLPEFKFPDLKHMFEAIGYIARGLGWLLRKLMNPWLYIIPIILFFTVGFKSILLLFPWWIPLVFLYFSVKSDEPKPSVTHVNHLHKPVLIKHKDGWFWDEHTNDWKKIGHRRKRRHIRGEGTPLDYVIRSFKEKF
ncbi:uncharacterized protein LOC115878084 isoform X1 [Sitophilus oryzae]|uniref:Uncharacterized protein LOC115878084 isoform X1 n=1 Tax=Sitophilus oryzae TaxID=7048 RepID=A0A6J2XHY9_SITOR|nr:uncharacterized protein LOC115878084 isoform X1 [Sitophilus oryzae]